MKSIYHFVMLSLSLLTSCLPGCTAELNDEGVDDANPKVAAIAFQGLGDLPGGDFDSHAFGVSTDGTTVVGSSYSKDGENEAFRWTQLEGMTGLGDLQGERPRRFNSRADAASRNGKVIIGSGTPGSTKAFRWVKVDGMHDIGSLPGRYSSSSAQDISGDGSTIVGYSLSGESSRREAFRWTEADGMQGLGGLVPFGTGGSTASAISSDGTTIVGSSESTKGAFRWTKATGMQGLGLLPAGAVQSQAEDVSGDGSVVAGTLRYGGTKEMAFRWAPTEGLQVLPDLPGGHEYCTASAISEDGKTVVGAGYSDVGSEAVRWTNSGGVESIQKSLMDRGVDMTGWRLWIATDLSSEGSVIVGFAINPAQKWEAWRADLSIHPARDSK